MGTNSELQDQTMETLEHEFQANKRLKTLNSSPSSFSKGKEKMEESVSESEENSMDCDQKTCGICLSDEGKAIRGYIDSCDHYFCFVCIMEWSKVESRCPMCKCRFSSIRRPQKYGVFLFERTVNVPVRDQVYHIFGNASTGPQDPYAHVQCNICNGIQDESLLLLCDLCDSASHTYCVGLGYTVPEGDWFCQDCTISRAEHADDGVVINCDSENKCKNSNRISDDTCVSIFDIIRDSDDERPEEVVSPSPGLHISSSIGDKERETNHKDEETKSAARTLRRCRNVHSHIRVLRKNWNSIRSGKLSFGSCTLKYGEKNNQEKLDFSEVKFDGATQENSAISSGCHPLKSQNDFSEKSHHDSRPYDTEKAWKMMDIAKSVQRAHEKTTTFAKINALRRGDGESSTPCGSNILLKKENQKLTCFNSEKQKHCEVTRTSRSSEVSYNKGSLRQCPLSSYNSEIQKHTEVTRTSRSTEASSNKGSSRQCPLSSSMQVQGSVKTDSCFKNKRKTSLEMLHGACHVQGDASSARILDDFKGGGGMEKDSVAIKTVNDHSAKSEIQSLVKLNLKLLNINKPLGVDEFKKIARLSTHSILAACGLEPLKSGIHRFPSSVCSHTDENEKLLKSTLMPNSCRECFYAFVKDVVHSIMSEKMDRDNVATGSSLV